MNAARLLQHFERISEAPDAVARLRRFILDLAVRGKLVEQDPGDEPASELLERIRAEKARQVKEGKISREKPPIPAAANELAFELKQGWQAARISQILVELQTGPFGSSLHQSDYQKGGIPVINPASIKNERLVPIDSMSVGPATLERLATFKLRAGDIVMARRGEMGRCAVVSKQEDGWLCGTGSLILRLPECVFPRFFVTLIGSPFVRKYLGGSAVGATMQNLNQSILLSLVIGLPPRDEQHRIVAKVEELMALCNRLEAAQADRERQRDRLVAASLYRLDNGADSESFREHARFHLRYVPRLTTRPEHIQQLRQTILNLAVRGQLVVQDPKDEPAAELLKRIQAEKEWLVEEGKIKKQQPLPPSAKVDAPFQLPPGWLLAQIQEIFVSVTDGDHLPPPKTQGGIPFLVIGNVRSQSIDFAGCRHVSEEYYNSLDPIRRPAKGDILYTLVGSYGISILITDDRAFCVQRHIGILRPSSHVNAQFVKLALESRLVFDQAKECATGIAQKTVPLSDLRRIWIPLPPFAEQRHIVTEVEKLMVLCDRLKGQLTTTQTESHRFLESTLSLALAA